MEISKAGSPDGYAGCSRTHPLWRRSSCDKPSVQFSFFNDEKKLSIAALSQTFSERLIEQMMLWLPMRRWNCSLVYWADSTGRRNNFDHI
jgi:hypothetical protein